MVQAASNLLQSVIEFFGILLPGLILAYLHSSLLLTVLNSNNSLEQTQKLTDWSWVLVLIVAVILGHFLHAFSDPLDSLAARIFPSPKTKAYLDRANDSMKLPHAVPDNSKNYFYFVFSFIRIHHAGAVAELERQAANYKFFRSLVLLCLLDIPFSILDPFVSRNFLFTRLGVLFLLACLAAIVSKLLFEWMYQLAFELYIQIREFENQQAVKNKALPEKR